MAVLGYSRGKAYKKKWIFRKSTRLGIIRIGNGLFWGYLEEEEQKSKETVECERRALLFGSRLSRQLTPR